MIIIQSNQDKLDSQSAEISSLQQELARLKSKFCPTCGQAILAGHSVIEPGLVSYQRVAL